MFQKREEDKKAKDAQLAGLQETFKQSIGECNIYNLDHEMIYHMSIYTTYTMK